MILTEKLKEEIDSMDYEQLLRRWRYAPTGDRIFEHDSGEYFLERMMKLKGECADAVAISKKIDRER